MVLFFQGQSSRIGDADGILPMLKMSAAAICIYLQRCLAPVKGRCLTLRKSLASLCERNPKTLILNMVVDFCVWFVCVCRSLATRKRKEHFLFACAVCFAPPYHGSQSDYISRSGCFLPKAYLSNAIKPMCKTRAICSSKPTSDRAFKNNGLLALCFDYEACVLNLIEYKQKRMNLNLYRKKKIMAHRSFC